MIDSRRTQLSQRIMNRRQLILGTRKFRRTSAPNDRAAASRGLSSIVATGMSVPEKRRTGPWDVQVGAFLKDKRANSDVGDTWLHRMEWELRRFPRLMDRVGQPFHRLTVEGVTEDSVHALRDGLPWEPPTFAIHFQALRQFLRWAGNPIALESSLWRLPSGSPVHRRWLTGDQLAALYRGARGIERVIVVLEGFNGLRRVEVLRLRVKDVLVNEQSLRVLGKGRRGGKWRVIPMQQEVARVVGLWIRGKGEDQRVVPLSRSGADAALQRAVRRSGLASKGTRVSHHDLRRTFGRVANASGMSLVSLQGLFGHASPALSAHYIGLDFDELKSALDRFGAHLGPVTSIEQGSQRAGSLPRFEHRTHRHAASARRFSSR